MPAVAAIPIRRPTTNLIEKRIAISSFKEASGCEAPRQLGIAHEEDAAGIGEFLDAGALSRAAAAGGGWARSSRLAITGFEQHVS